MKTSYALFCVHRGVEHYLQSAPTLDGVKVTKGKVLNWLDAMGVQLSHEHPTLLVIHQDGKPILQANYGPSIPAWRPYRTPDVLPVPPAPTAPVLHREPIRQPGATKHFRSRLDRGAIKPTILADQPPPRKSYDQLVAELSASLAALETQTSQNPPQNPPSG
jgi:hypothetical protein